MKRNIVAILMGMISQWIFWIATPDINLTRRIIAGVMLLMLFGLYDSLVHRRQY
jgi:hypothetical protein